MPTVDDCQKCTNHCPQAKLAHDTALGRMYATNELTVLLKKVECGQLVEVVRCGECKHRGKPIECPMCYEEFVDLPDGDWDTNIFDYSKDDGFCSYGERKDGED